MTHYIQDCIKEIEDYCFKNGIQHRFVGGVSYGGLLNKDTTYEIDIQKKIVDLKKHNALTDLRKDGTVRDIDIIVLEGNLKKVSALQDFIYTLQEGILKKYKVDLPISVEAAIFPEKGERNWLMQLVTAIEVEQSVVYGKGQLHLVFEDLKQPISWATMEAWKVRLENGVSYTTRNPLADFYAYSFRSPGGVKFKDINKLVFLKKMAHTMNAMGLNNNPKIDYNNSESYGSWKQYIHKLHDSSNVSIKLKSIFIRLYWNTIGTYIAHGKGTIGHFLARFATRFTGVRQ